jgi:diadenosine tetraphosphate (Ap4A) HIT family hydrolase
MRVPCVFCERLEVGPLIATSEHAAAFADAFPVSLGHTLVVPRRHEPDFFALASEEQAAVWTLTAAVVGDLTRAHRPDGFNVGVNAGAAAGQTVMHAHVHVIPRYAGDIDDPRGGVRWVKPSQADYWGRP